MIVGVTGGIGSGKTTVVNFFKELDVPVYIADEEAKRLMGEDNQLISSIKDEFGHEAYTEDNTLNKTYLADQVFGNPKKLQQLNNLVHPVVRQDFNDWLSHQNSAYVIYESALIFEHNQQDNFDVVILVTAPVEERIKRVTKREGWSINDVQKRINQQMDDNKKKDKSKYIIKNTEINLTKKKVNRINAILLSICE